MGEGLVVQIPSVAECPPGISIDVFGEGDVVGEELCRAAILDARRLEGEWKGRCGARRECQEWIPFARKMVLAGPETQMKHVLVACFEYRLVGQLDGQFQSLNVGGGDEYVHFRLQGIGRGGF